MPLALGRRPVPEGRLRRSAAAALATVLLGAAGAVLPVVPAHAAGPGPMLYLTNLGWSTVTAVDPATGSKVATIPVDGGPRNLAVTPDGSQVWVSSSGVNHISVIDPTTNTVTGTVGLGCTPTPTAFSPDGARAYVGCQEGGVEVVDTATRTVTATVATGKNVQGIATSPDGGRLYVANNGSASVSIIDTATDTVTATVTIPTGGAYRLAVSPDGAHVYVTHNRFNTVAVIDTATAAVTAEIKVGVYPQGVAVSPDGKYLYTANVIQTVSVVDTATDTVVASVPTHTSSAAVAVSPDGSRVYTSSVGDGPLVAIDTATNTAAYSASVGDGGYDLVLDDPVPPAATGLAPDHGPTTGGTTVTLTGSHLYGTTGVSFDGVPASSFKVVNDTTVTATAPAHAVGAAQVSLTARGRTVTAGTYDYQAPPPVVTGIAPAQGPLAGGNTVTITGSNFTGATAVSFGSTPAAAFAVDSDTRITATAPAASTVGAVGITVTTPGGTSTAAQYGYVYPFSGFQAPVVGPPAVNGIKAGRAVPIQFSLGGDRGLGVLAAGQPTAQQTDCSTGTAIGSAVPARTAGGSTLQYDAASDTYTYVWKTDKAWSGTCQTFTLSLNDGTTHTALFQLR